MKILSFGEILFDVYGEEKVIGGAPFNFSAHAVRAGAEALFLTAVGNDTLGDIAIEKIKKYGVNASLAHRTEKYATGVCNVTLNEKGVPKYRLAENTAYDHLPFYEKITETELDGLYFGTLALRSLDNRETVKKLIACGRYREIMVDVNVRLPFCSEAALLIGMENATVLKISDEELPYVTDTVVHREIRDPKEAVEIIAERFGQLRHIIITCGEKGAMACDTVAHILISVPAVKTRVVSTVGAGDSFSATFFVNYLNKSDIAECLRLAAEVSAYVVSQKDAIPD